MRPFKLLQRGGLTIACSLTTLSLGVDLSVLPLSKDHKVRFITVRLPFLYLSFNWTVKS